MGFFGSTTKTYYSSTSTILFEQVQGIIKQTTLNAVLENRNIANDLRANLANGISTNANRLYSFAKNGSYHWGLPTSSMVHLQPSTASALKIIIQKEIGKPIYLASSFVDVEPISSHIWYRASYYLLDPLGNISNEITTWEYDESTNVYPSLDLELSDVQDVSVHYPVIPMRLNGVSTVEDDAPYKSDVVQACNYLGLKAYDLSTAIEKQSETGDNPIEDAYVVIGLEITNKTEEGMGYLYTYFSHMHGYDQVNQSDYEYWEANSEKDDEGVYITSPPHTSVVIKDATYKMELGWLYITDSIVTGSIAKRGEHFTDYNRYTNISVNNNNFYSAGEFCVYKQISLTQYRKLTVKGLTHSNWALGHEVRTSLYDAFEEPEGLAHSFIVPLRKDFLSAIGAVRTHDLMYSSIRMVVNDRFVQRLKWYQQSWFQVVLLVIAVVISVVTGNPATGAALWSAATIAVAVVKVILMKIVFTVGMELLEDLIGDELALLVQVVAMFYLGGANTGSAINAGMTGVQGAQGLYYENELEDIQKQINSITELNEDLLSEEVAQEERVLRARGLVDGDTYAIMDPTRYVKRLHLETKLPTLIGHTTSKFTDMMKFTDRPDSYIRLGNS